MEKLSFDGVGINDAGDQFKPRLATFSDALRKDEARTKSLGALLESAPAMLCALEGVAKWAEIMGGWESSVWDDVRAAIALAKGG